MRIPTTAEEIIPFALDIKQKCMASQGNRSAYYRLLNAIAETGRADNGGKAMINMQNAHLERTAAHLFSPVELKFTIDYDNVYPDNILQKGKIFAKRVTRQWQRAGTDTMFGRGVYESLKYGAALMKQWPTMINDKMRLDNRLVMPWNFGVYREDQNDLEEQQALCETTLLTMEEVWSRIWNLPNAQQMFLRIKSQSSSNQGMSQPDSYFHSVLSSSQLNTTGLQASTRPLPGGIVQVSSDANQIIGPTVAAETVPFHEIWIRGPEDWVTIQIIEPDILVTVFKLSNLLIPGSQMQPYRLIQANEVSNWFWGRSELVDLIEPQGWLNSMTEDARRLIGLQVDKLLGFSGETMMTDELYAQARMNGFINAGANAKIEDLTPKFPPELLPMIKFVLEMINTLGSFPEIMQGKGEQGVRAGVHANTLLKTASPTLRDRSLVIERQCATHADLTGAIMEAKDGAWYWTKGDKPQDVEETKFLLSQLPEDWWITVDSHSSSPIFMDEASQLIFQGAKMGYVDGEYVLENLPFPNKEAAKRSLEKRQEQQAKEKQAFMEKFPEEAGKLGIKMFAGGRR